jgi:serine/threonine protein kinase
MGPATFSKHYCVCIQQDGTPREISRLGSVVTYKAIDYRSGRPVELQVIPLTSVDQSAREQFQEQARSAQKLDHVNIAKVFAVGVEDEHIVFVSEYLQGETADAWVVAHGPMDPDAVLRVGLQVVSALAAAMFHSLTHRSIQPSNLMIVPGTTAEGEWPLVKLLNFGLAGLKLYSEGSEPRELAPPISPQFASPEQLQDRIVDFRSEIFSLGATMCFLLTGAVPLAGVPNKAGIAERVLPSVRQIPRPLRKVLSHMLRHNPEERPQDPVVFAEELRNCLQKVGHREIISRRSVVPITAGFDSEIEGAPNRLRPIALAIAAFLLTAGVLAAVLMPERWQSLLHPRRDISALGIPVGVPEATPGASAPINSAPSGVPENAAPRPALPSNANETNSNGNTAVASVANPSPNGTVPSPPLASPAIADRDQDASAPDGVTANRAQNPPAVEQRFAGSPPTPASQSSPANANVRPTAVTPRLAAKNRTAEPPPPAEGPADSAGEKQTAQEQPTVAKRSRDESETPNTTSELRTPQDVWNNLRSNADRAVVNASPSAATKPRTQSKATASKRNANNSRRQRLAGDRRRSLPQMRVGSMRAEFVGTTEDGSWILQLPNGKTVVTPPVPNPEDVPIEKPRRVRRAVIAPHDTPVDQRPPVVVVPADN